MDQDSGLHIISDLDLAFYQIRFSSKTDGSGDWLNSVNLVTKVSRPATSITVPARVGTYLIKAVDKLGNTNININTTIHINKTIHINTNIPINTNYIILSSRACEHMSQIRDRIDLLIFDIKNLLCELSTLVYLILNIT